MENNNTIEIVNNDTLIEIDDGSNIESLYNNFTLIDYASMPDIPKINSVKILGNLSSEDLGLASADKVEEKNNKENSNKFSNTDKKTTIKDFCPFLKKGKHLELQTGDSVMLTFTYTDDPQ